MSPLSFNLIPSPHPHLLPGWRWQLGVSICNEPSEGRRPPRGADKFIIPVSREVEPENDESIILKRQVRRHSPDCWGCWVHCWLLREVDSGDEAVSSQDSWSDLPHRRLCLVCGDDGCCCVCRCFSAARWAVAGSRRGIRWQGGNGRGLERRECISIPGAHSAKSSCRPVGASAGRSAALHGC